MLYLRLGGIHRLRVLVGDAFHDPGREGGRHDADQREPSDHELDCGDARPASVTG